MSEESKLGLPKCAAEYIDLVVKKMGYRRKVRAEVRQELTGHFEEALRKCTDDAERQEAAHKLIAEFGDPKTLATLIRRGKKRCRPIWLKAIIRSLQAAGIAVIALVVYIAVMLTGRPYITVDYVAQFNKMVRPVADDSLNADPYYEKAAALRTAEPNDLPRPWDGEATASQVDTARQWVASNAAAIQEVRKGNEKPYSWRTYSAPDGTLMSILLPELGERNKLANLLSWQARLEAQDGDFEKALDGVCQCYLLGRHMDTQYMIIGQLVAAAIELRSVSVAQVIIAMPAVKPDTLAKFQADYEKLLAGSNFRIRFDGESMFIKDAIQRTFTKSGRVAPLMMSRYMVQGFNQATSSQHSDVAELARIVAFGSYMVLTHPDKETTLKQAMAFYKAAQRFADATPYEARSIRPTPTEEINRLVGVNQLLGVALPAIERAAAKSWRVSAQCHGLLAQIAAERYKRDKGGYPDSLAELQQTGYLRELPMDPWSDKPLVYRKTADGYTLYSVGTNFTDDGGKNIDKDGKPILSNVANSIDGLDIVFWPAAKSK